MTSVSAERPPAATHKYLNLLHYAFVKTRNNDVYFGLRKICKIGTFQAVYLSALFPVVSKTSFFGAATL